MKPISAPDTNHTPQQTAAPAVPTSANLYLLSDKQMLTLMQSIRQSRRIVICAHRGPDGDAVGSSLGWAEYLLSLGKEVKIVLPNPFPDFLRWLPGSHTVQFYARHEAAASQTLNNADLIFCLDFNSLARLQDMESAVSRSHAERIVIDHHLGPDPACGAQIYSYPELCSTSEAVFRIILQLGGMDKVSKSAATCLYTGMMTDTGGFTYNSTRPEIYQVISLLLTTGIDKDKIYRQVFNVYSPYRIRLTGYILYEKLRFYENDRAAIFTLTREEMTRFHFIRGDAEGLVNMPLQVKGMRLSISLREDTERDIVRVSLRSVDDFPCNRMAEEYFNGGGHLNASGGELPFPLDEAVHTAERAIKAYRDKL